MLLQNKLDFYATVLDLRTAVGSLNILRALRKLSNEEWDRCRNDATDEHLIRGVFVNSTKTDAIRAYIAKLVKLYMNSVGMTAGAWTKKGLEDEHILTKAVSDKICNSEINSADQLFEMVVTRLLGVDKFLVKAAMTAEAVGIASALVEYLGYRADETSDPLVSYGDLVKELTKQLFANKLDDQFYEIILDDGCKVLALQLQAAQSENAVLERFLGIEVLEQALILATPVLESKL